MPEADTAGIEEITETDPMRQEINRGLMVQWINADLVNRAWGDVDKSVVFYDGDKLFSGAFHSMPPETMWELMRNGPAQIRYWSWGIV